MGEKKTHKQRDPFPKSWDIPMKILFTCFFLCQKVFFAPNTGPMFDNSKVRSAEWVQIITDRFVFFFGPEMGPRWAKSLR